MNAAAAELEIATLERFWRWQVLGWLAYGLAMYLAAAQALGFGLALVNKSVNVTIGFSLSLGLRWIFLQLHRRDVPTMRVVPALLTACFLAGAIWSGIANSFFWWYMRGDFTGMGVEQAFAWTLVHTIVFVAWCAIYLGATVFDDRQRTAAMSQANRAVDAGSPPLVVRAEGELLRLPQDQIHCIEAARNYSCIVSDAGTHVVRLPLSTLGARLDARSFIRVHRSAIVAVNKLRSLRVLPTQDAIVTLTGGREIRVSRGFRAKVEQVLARSH